MIAICIGHSRKINNRTEGGAWSERLQKNEHSFNSVVAKKLAEILTTNGIPHFTLNIYEGNGYGAAMRWAAQQIKARGAKLAIELHYNSASASARGHEWLHWHSSKNGKALAESFRFTFSQDYPHHKDRGLKSITSQDRGGEFLRLTHCPSVILEPFFGSSAEDSAAFSGHDGAAALASTYAASLLRYLKK